MRCRWADAHQGEKDEKHRKGSLTGDRVRFSLAYNGDYQSFKKSDWSFLKNSITGHEITNRTPVTKGPTVCLVYLRIDPTTDKWLKEKKHIYDFVTFDEWFDDLCFVKNGEVVFASCTHEEFCEISSELRSLYENDL